MKRSAGLVKVCAVLGAAALVPFLCGCPEGFDLGSIFNPPGVGALTVTASSSGETTVDKTISLVAEIAGGTEPYTVEWAQTSGPWASVTSADAATASFVPLAAGIYKFKVSATDSGTRTVSSGTAEVELVVADIQFNLNPSGVVGASADVRIGGNPATVRVRTVRSGLAQLYPRVSVFDPQYTDDELTQMTVTYDIISVPVEARSEDVSLDREFDTISNQGTGDVDNNTGAANSNQTLDGVVGVSLRPNPDITYKTITNLATVVNNFGMFAPGEYVFRVTVTNPGGTQRTRDLVVNLVVEEVVGTYGSDMAGGTAVSAGPGVIRVKALPTAGGNNVNNRILLPSQTAAMTVSVFPSTTTSYRFYVQDGLGVAHTALVSPADTTLSATGDPQDVALTFGASGMTPGTYTLMFESFDGLGQLTPGAAVAFNGAAANVVFHVTQDYLASTTLNAALVGAVSHHPDAPVDYKGWTGAVATYGAVSALADVNLDGALDIVTLTGTNVNVNTTAYLQGSTEALRHPTNGNFGAAIGAAAAVLNAVNDPNGAAATQMYDMAVGDLNGDGLPDIAIGAQAIDPDGAGFLVGDGYVQIFFHTGNPANPYSAIATDQSLYILPPTWDRQTYNTDTAFLGALAAVVQAQFGTQVGIMDQDGDGELDLVVTDPGFTKFQVLTVTAPTAPAIAPPGIGPMFYNGQEGRVYVFQGGATSALKPNRPDIITSHVTERLRGNTAVTTRDTTFAETNINYWRYYEGSIYDVLGASLAVSAKGFAVGSPLASGNGTWMAALDIVNPIQDGDTVTLTVDFVPRTYEFETSAFYNGLPPATPGTVAVGNREVNLGGDNTAANALARLGSVINDDLAGYTFASAAVDGAIPERLNIFYEYGAVDGSQRSIAVPGWMPITETFANTLNVAVDPGTGNAGDWVLNLDGVVYRVAQGAAEGTLPAAGAIYGTTNSNMGLGTALALGMHNGTTAADDLAIGAFDDGTATGVNDGVAFAGGDDGAVFVLLDGSNTLGTALTAGAATLRSGGLGGDDLPPTSLGDSIAFGDINGDGLDDLLFTEPGFDRIYGIFGATTPVSVPEITFFGVNVDASLGTNGTFLFGDVTGDTFDDWLFINGVDHFGFLGTEGTP
ncbi:MAG: FG-GAP repeat protein [Phycisphaerae bacterium]|nr:FG-GAP repeat protein [Phycisphaerae bacterium]